MKRLLPFVLVLCLLLCGCGKSDEPVDDPADAGEEQIADDLVEVILHRNPLNGAPLDAPYEGRVFAVTIDNVSSAVPHHGLSQADIYVEMFVNDYCTRGLALFSDMEKIESAGPIRSTRYNFTDLALAYDLIVCHASGSAEVREDMYAAGVDNIFATGSAGYRDEERYNNGHAWEHTLFIKGESAVAAAADEGFDLTRSGKDYGLQFAEDGTPANGSAASVVDIGFTLDGYVKHTAMKYDTATGRYVYWQYDQEMIDENNSEPEAFDNVIVLLAVTTSDGKYHVADLYGSGEGYFACGGKAVPIRWSHAGETDPILFTLADGTPLELGVGATFMAIAPVGSAVQIS